MPKILVIPRGGEDVYRILRQKIDHEAKTFAWADKKKRRLKHVQPSAGQIRIHDARGVLLAEAFEGDQIVGAFIGRLAAWFPQEIAAINIQVLIDTSTKKRPKR